MGWSTDFYDDFTYGTSTGNIGGGMVTYYDRKFLRRTKETLVFAPFGQRRPLPKGNGKIIQFFRYNNIATSVSGSYLTEGQNPNATLITGQNVSATIVEWGGFSQHSSLVAKSHLDRALLGVSDLWGENAGNTIDLIASSVSASQGAYPMRADGNDTGDGTYSFEGTVDSATSTTVTDSDISANSNFGDANDDLNQSIIIMTSGTSYGQSRPITDYVTSGGVITVSPAFTTTPVAGDTFHVVSAHGLTSSDLLTTANIRKGVIRLKNNKAAKMSASMYVGIISPDTEGGLMADTNWTNVMQYKDRPDMKVQGLFNGEVGMWGGVRWIVGTQPFRFPITTVGTAGAAYGVGAWVPGTSYTNYAAAGAVYSNMILGKESFGTTTFRGEASSLLRPGIITKKSGPGDTSNPLNRYETVGWELPYIAMGLNSMFAVQMWSGG